MSAAAHFKARQLGLRLKGIGAIVMFYCFGYSSIFNWLLRISNLRSMSLMAGC